MGENNEQIKKIKRSTSYRKLKENLLSQLAEKNSDIPVFTDLVESYMDLWVVKELLTNDIADRGVYITTINGKGQEQPKKNDSVSELSKITAQMLKVLTQLKLEVNNESTSPTEDDEL